MEKNGNQELGIKGEQIACSYLKKQGYRILETRFLTRWGEIDIVAKKPNKISFIEVKTRSQTIFGPGLAAIHDRKWLRLQKASVLYLRKHAKRYHNYHLEFLGIGIQIIKHQITIDCVNLFPD